MIPTRTERYVWRSLLFVPLAGVLIAAKGLLSGAPTNPALVGALTGLDWQQLRTEEPDVAQLVTVMKRHESLALLGWAFWLAWSNIHADRFSSRWIWYGWWTVPVLTIGVMLTGARTGGALRGSLLGVTAITIAGLLVCRRWLLAADSRSP